MCPGIPLTPLSKTWSCLNHTFHPSFLQTASWKEHYKIIWEMENFIQQKISFKLVNHNKLQIMLNIYFLFSQDCGQRRGCRWNIVMVIEKKSRNYIVFSYLHSRWGNITVPLHMFIYVTIYLMSVFPDKSHVRKTVFTTVSPAHKVPSGGTELFDEWCISWWIME